MRTCLAILIGMVQVLEDALLISQEIMREWVILVRRVFKVGSQYYGMLMGILTLSLCPTGTISSYVPTSTFLCEMAFSMACDIMSVMEYQDGRSPKV